MTITEVTEKFTGTSVSPPIKMHPCVGICLYLYHSVPSALELMGAVGGTLQVVYSLVELSG